MEETDANRRLGRDYGGSVVDLLDTELAGKAL